MRIKPIENPREKMKESIKIAERLVLAFLVIVGIVTMICFIASFYSELYESTYGSRIEVLESKNEELMKEIERLEDEISQKSLRVFWHDVIFIVKIGANFSIGDFVEFALID